MRENRGGAREGAGRPTGTIKPDKKESMTLRLTSEQRKKLSALGGAEWIRNMIDETSANATVSVWPDTDDERRHKD